MTIIKPKEKNNISFIVLMFAVAIIGGMFYISQYNGVADNRYKIKELKLEIAEAEEQNVELKNNFYKIVDPTELEKMAGDHGLVLDKNPDYLDPESIVLHSD
jgi:cell division protein FtsL